MSLFRKILKILLAIFMGYAGIQHFLKPGVFLPFVPDFLPLKMPIVFLSGVVEIVLGVLLLLP